MDLVTAVLKVVSKGLRLVDKLGYWLAHKLESMKVVLWVGLTAK